MNAAPTPSRPVAAPRRPSPVQTSPYGHIDDLWRFMRQRWGSLFDQMWATPAGLTPAQLTTYFDEQRKAWHHELGSLKTAQITYGKGNLPPRPCTLIEFKTLCLRAPDFSAVSDARKLPAPANRRAAARARQDNAAIVGISNDPLARQRQHMVDEIAGVHVSLANKAFWRQALRHEIRRLYGIDTATKFDLAELAQAIKDRAATRGEPQS
jgi:hypothetical protein